LTGLAFRYSWIAEAPPPILASAPAAARFARLMLARSRPYRIVSPTDTSDPGPSPNRCRISFFTGKRYVPRLESGKMEVRHVSAPIVTSTRRDLNPRARWPNASPTRSARSSGRLTKCHDEGPSHSQTREWKEK
jgi:hypothetical protein